MKTRQDTSNITREALVTEYVIKEKSCREIGRMFGVGHDVILAKLRKYGIPRRSNSRRGRRDIVPRMSKFPISPGDTFRKLTTIRKLELISGLEKWECSCECGGRIDVLARDWRKKRIGSCGCLKNAKYDGYEGVSGNLFGRYKYGARVRGIAFGITAKDMWNKFVSQEEKCAVSGVPIALPADYRRLNHTASLDRIDSSGGYTPYNIQWVHKRIQTMKWDLSSGEFVEWCRKVTENNAQ